MFLILYKMNANLSLFVRDFKKGWSDRPNPFRSLDNYWIIHTIFLKYCSANIYMSLGNNLKYKVYSGFKLHLQFKFMKMERLM